MWKRASATAGFLQRDHQGPRQGGEPLCPPVGGRGQYGHCVIELAPREPGAGYEFVDKIVGGVIPREYIPAVDKGMREALKSGKLGGYEVVDVQATLLDGSYHEVDSSEMAFTIAGSLAIKEALEKAQCALLEPMMKVEVLVPEDYLGDVMGNITSRRGKLSGWKFARTFR